MHRLKGLAPVSKLNLTISTTSDSISVLPPTRPLTFPRPIYGGEPIAQWINSSSDDWESLFLPPGWYAAVGQLALWGVVPSRGELAAGSYDITGFGSGESRLFHPSSILEEE